MKKTACIILVSLLAIACLLTGIFAFPLGGKEMVLNGTGARSIFLLGTVYYISLYVPESMKGKDGTAILEADEPMQVILLIDSGMLTMERFVKAIREGFEKAAGSGYYTDQGETFLTMFGGLVINKGDYVYLQYVPGAGVVASVQPAGGAIKGYGTVPGLAFKKALFAIWLGPDPVQSGCKSGMLGQ